MFEITMNIFQFVQKKLFKQYEKKKLKFKKIDNVNFALSHQVLNYKIIK